MKRGDPPSKEGDAGHEDGPVKLRGQQLAEILRAEVLDGTLEPGTRIRQEELAARLGSSRIPIREALRQLEAEGLVVLVANSGAWVARIDLNECLEIYKIRERLEPLALANSVEHITDDDVLELEQLTDAIERCTSIDEFLRLDRQFHLLSYRRSSYALLRNMIEGFWNKTQYYRRAHATVLGDSNRWVIHAEHRLILEAIRNRDPEDAGRILEGHIRRTRLRLARNSELFR